MEENNWYQYVIECDTHRNAAMVAADMNLWLHAWTWLENSNLTGGDYRLYVNIEYVNENEL